MGLMVSGCFNRSSTHWQREKATGNATADTPKNGLVKTYYPSGKLKDVCHYVNGKRNGKAIHYYENGKIATVANFRNDDFYGKVTFYYSNGQKNSVEYYKIKGLTPFKLWYENGVLKQKGNHLDDKMSGKWLLYYPDGKLQEINYYNSNLKDSVWIYFSEAGDTIKKEWYKDNVLIKTEKY